MLLQKSPRSRACHAEVAGSSPTYSHAISKRDRQLDFLPQHVGVAGARVFRRHLATEAVKPGAGADVLRAALALVPRNASPVSAAV